MNDDPIHNEVLFKTGAIHTSEKGPSQLFLNNSGWDTNTLDMPIWNVIYGSPNYSDTEELKFRK